MARERVIVEIQNLEQALRVEETIKTGYCDTISENFLAWIAVEEDLADSYSKLSEKFENKEKVKKAITGLSEESRKTIELVQKLLDSVEELGAARDRRRSIIQELIEQNPKDFIE